MRRQSRNLIDSVFDLIVLPFVLITGAVALINTIRK